MIIKNFCFWKVMQPEESTHDRWKAVLMPMISQKITHMWRWGTPQNPFLVFIDEIRKTQKRRILEKWKKNLEISSFYISATKTTIIWGTVSETRSETKFFVILGHFLLFYPTIDPKILIWKNIKKTLEILSFYTCVP